jgi:hypothetical protein
MNFASFKISIEESIKFLSEQGLYKSKGFKPIGIHSEEFKNICRKNRHTDIYNVAIENNDFEILLCDDSIFQFTLDNGILRYTFIQNPHIFISRENYLNAIYTPEELLQFTDTDLLELNSSIKDEEYEQFYNEQDINLESHIIRYDLDDKGYSPLIHAFSHLHIGLNENLRIPCSKILTPHKFVIFVIKNTYYDDWKKAHKKDEKLPILIKESKERCRSLPSNYWNDIDKYELYLY